MPAQTALPLNPKHLSFSWTVITTTHCPFIVELQRLSHHIQESHVPAGFSNTPWALCRRGSFFGQQQEHQGRDAERAAMMTFYERYEAGQQGLSHWASLRALSIQDFHSWATLPAREVSSVCFLEHHQLIGLALWKKRGLYYWASVSISR